MNPAYVKLVKPMGIVMDERSVEFQHLKQLYEKAIQGYLREARRSFDVKIFKARVWKKDVA